MSTQKPSLEDRVAELERLMQFAADGRAVGKLHRELQDVDGRLTRLETKVFGLIEQIDRNEKALRKPEKWK